MNEIVEIIYQWHQGNTIKGIKRSLRFDRKTIRKHILMAKQLGVLFLRNKNSLKDSGPFPDLLHCMKHRPLIALVFTGTK